jgi:hypothetical protein
MKVRVPIQERWRMRLLSIGLAVSLSLSAMGCSGDDDASDTGGPVPADEARVEITFTGDGASFVGDREIAEGAVTVVFSNESDSAARFAILGYETGSDALAEELEVMDEGDAVVTRDAPTDGYFEVGFDGLGEAVSAPPEAARRERLPTSTHRDQP